MEPFEVMTSESQERMLAIVEPERPRRGARHLRSVGGAGLGRSARCTGEPGAAAHPRRLDGEVLADVPAASLHEDAPLYDRPRRRAGRPRRAAGRRPGADAAAHRPTAGADLLDLLADTSWVWSQYDHQLFLNTVEGPGGDAAVLRLKHPTTGARHRPRPGAHHRRQPPLVRRRPAAGHGADRGRGGAQPRRASAPARSAVVNCLNFGNPEHPEVMWQLSEAIDGMAEACRALGIPVVGGNVSLYNESRGRRHRPDPGRRHARADRPRSTAARRGVALVDGGRAPAARRRPSPELGGSAWAWRRRPPRRSPAGARPRPPRAVVADLVRTLVVDGHARRRARRRPTAASAWRWPRWRCAPASGFTVPGIADHAGAVHRVAVTRGAVRRARRRSSRVSAPTAKCAAGVARSPRSDGRRLVTALAIEGAWLTSRSPAHRRRSVPARSADGRGPLGLGRDGSPQARPLTELGPCARVPSR